MSTEVEMNHTHSWSRPVLQANSSGEKHWPKFSSQSVLNSLGQNCLLFIYPQRCLTKSCYKTESLGLH